jgi:hypothetical protein
VTRAIAGQLAALARSLETSHAPDAVAHFLMRCLFTMFAEDVGLLPAGSFTELLEVAHADPASFAPLAERPLAHDEAPAAIRWRCGGSVAHFNGKLFADAHALPLDAAQVALLATRPPAPTGATWSRRSSARCSNARSTRASATSWARTTPRAPTSSGWSGPR